MVSGAALLHQGLRAAGVRFIASLPDDWLVPLLDLIDKDPDITHVPVAREPELVGVCAGAWLGGTRPAAIMGIAGLLTCGHEFTTLNFAQQIPLFIVSAFRGTIEDPRSNQVGQGLLGVPYLDALQIPHMTITKPEEASSLPAAYTRTLLLKRPFVYFATKPVLLPADTKV